MRNIYSPIEVDEETLLRDDEKHELFYAKINKLPEDRQDLLFDVNTDNFLRTIAEQFQLNQSQTIEMVRLVRDIIIKDVPKENMTGELASRLQIGENIAKDVANKIVSGLFHLETGFPSGNPVSPKTDDKVNPNNVLDLRKPN